MMNANLQTALNKIDEQQKKFKQGSAPWCVGEQLKDMLRENATGAGIVAMDIDQKGMGLADCEKKIAAFAQAHRQGSVGFCGPADSNRIIRAFYGLPEAPAVSHPTPPAASSAAPKRKTIRLADFL